MRDSLREPSGPATHFLGTLTGTPVIHAAILVSLM